MRRLVLPLLAAAAFIAALRPYVADADEEGPDRLTRLEAHVLSLRADVAYLLARGTRSRAASRRRHRPPRATDLRTAAARAGGFQAAAIPLPPRRSGASRHARPAGRDRSHPRRGPPPRTPSPGRTRSTVVGGRRRGARGATATFSDTGWRRRGRLRSRAHGPPIGRRGARPPGTSGWGGPTSRGLSPAAWRTISEPGGDRCHGLDRQIWVRRGRRGR
jgi:hypothetical protein